MLTEIDKDYYCSIDCYKNGRCEVNDLCADCNLYHHRKYPTPEQYLEEYGVEWTGAVYAICKIKGCTEGCHKEWGAFRNIKHANDDLSKFNICERRYIVCACTPFGKPPVAWRPE